MKIIEFAGFITGYFLGLVTGVVSFLRQARMFHPRGHLFEAEVISATFPPHAMVRFSAAMWKEKEWIDVLGISIRFSKHRPDSILIGPEDQDLLFATIEYPWQTPIAPFFTRYHDFFKNIYFAVSPFKNEKNEIVKYRLVPKNSVIGKGDREEKLFSAVLVGNALFDLEMQSQNIKGDHWARVARLKILRPLNFDQEALRFNPFNTGLNIRPVGFVHHLRIGAYRLSQTARPKMAKEKSLQKIRALE